ncbi:MAG TPA: chemotaxis protein CheW [Polyangiaceae bacterium]|nr:chemotaxis protein CheW [Polyangiaceae bacterium]
MLASHSHGSALGAGQGRAVLLCQVGLLVCALPLEHVSETMRPLSVEFLSGTASFVAGVSIIRGGPVPVVDLARLLGSATDEVRARLVVVRVGERHVALSVGRVIGVRALESSRLGELPPLLGGASAEVITALGSLDARLLLLLETSRMLPDSGWASLEARGAEA